MKTKITLALLVLATAIVSCRKEEKTPPTVVTPPVIAPVIVKTGFSWKLDNGTEITTDSTFWTTGSWDTGIRAKITGTAYFFEINWSTINNTAVGAKTLALNNYGFYYADTNGLTYNITADQTLNITAFASDKLSGNFAFTIKDNNSTNTKTISATFKDLVKK